MDALTEGTNLQTQYYCNCPPIPLTPTEQFYALFTPEHFIAFGLLFLAIEPILYLWAYDVINFNWARKMIKRVSKK